MCKKWKARRHNNRLAKQFQKTIEDGNFNSVDKALDAIDVNWELERVFDFQNDFKILGEDTGNWGVAEPNTLAYYTPEAIKISGIGNQQVLITCSKLEKPVIRKGWSGEKVARQYTAGSLHSKQPVNCNKRYLAVITTSAVALGAWDAFWFMYTGIQIPKGKGVLYSEVDWERMVDESSKLFKHTFSTHRGWKKVDENGKDIDGRKMFSHSVNVGKRIIRVAIDINFDAEKKLVQAHINNHLVYETLLGFPELPMTMIVNTRPSTFDGTIPSTKKLKNVEGEAYEVEESGVIDQFLPYQFRIESLSQYTKA